VQRRNEKTTEKRTWPRKNEEEWEHFPGGKSVQKKVQRAGRGDPKVTEGGAYPSEKREK